MASKKDDDTSWLFDEFPDWHKSVYVVDDKKADLKVPVNKGRESNIYLTYIIANYDHLPDVMLFIHPERYQWHNDDPYYDGLRMLRNLQLPYLEEQGYVNLRCAWILGCPAEIRPFEDEHREDVHAGEYFKKGFMELFPGVEVPSEVGASCCAQFGVTQQKVLQRPKADYEHYRDWLLHTSLPDALSGRIMEYSWHSMDMSIHEHISYKTVWLMHMCSDFWKRSRLLSHGRGLLLQRLWIVQSHLPRRRRMRWTICSASLFHIA